MKSSHSQLSPTTLSKKKANLSNHIDRINHLPCNVIDGILKYLNIQELVRTGLLSRKWRHAWNSVPQLMFDEEDFFSKFKNLDDPSPEICRIITEVLLQHNGPIYSFTLVIPPLSDIMITAEYLNKWLLFLSRRGVKDLKIFNYGNFCYKMPSYAFSCQELTHFGLYGFNVSVPSNLCGLKSLLDLYLELNTCEFGAFENLISGCPLLKKLSIDLFGDMKSICLTKAKNLTDLRLRIDWRYSEGLIKSLPKIERLTLESYWDKALYAEIIPPSQLIGLKYLKLDSVHLDERGELLYIVSILKSASNLVELVIETRNNNCEQEPDHLKELQCNSCCFSQLQTVNIRAGNADFKHAMSLIRFILKYSLSLKTLAFTVQFGHEKLDPVVLLSISRDLLLMERASQRARVEFKYKNHNLEHL